MPRKIIGPATNAVIEHVVRALSDFEPMTHRQYAEMTGIHVKAAEHRMIAALCAGAVHVSTYFRGRAGYPAPAYAIGRAPSALRPRSLTADERAAIRLERMRTDEKFRKKVRRQQRKYLKAQRLENSPMHQKRLAYQAKWHREKNGYQARRPKVESIDPMLAAIMGVKK